MEEIKHRIHFAAAVCFHIVEKFSNIILIYCWFCLLCTKKNGQGGEIYISSEWICLSSWVAVVFKTWRSVEQVSVGLFFVLAVYLPHGKCFCSGTNNEKSWTAHCSADRLFGWHSFIRAKAIHTRESVPKRGSDLEETKKMMNSRNNIWSGSSKQNRNKHANKIRWRNGIFIAQNFAHKMSRFCSAHGKNVRTNRGIGTSTAL